MSRPADGPRVCDPQAKCATGHKGRQRVPAACRLAENAPRLMVPVGAATVVTRAIAPALFDRQEKDFQSGYSADEVAQARRFIAKPDWDAMLRDTQAAIDAVKKVGPVGIIGFCLGGSIAYAAATKLSGLKAAIGYYGGAIVRFADDKPQVPTQLVYQGHVYMVNTQGMLTALDVKTGKPVYEEERVGLGSAYASPVAANGHIYLCGLDKSVVVVKAGDSPEKVSAAKLDDRISATPAIAGNAIYSRTGSSLYAFKSK